MQSVADAFSVAEVGAIRRPVQSTRVSWKKSLLPSIRLFTIGVSIIGGNDVIAGQDQYNSSWNDYVYEDESANIISITTDRELNQPIGGMVKGLATVRLDNTTGRYTPQFAGGSSAIFTAVGKPRRPLIINAGFNYGGIDNMIPQFVGVTSKSPQVNIRQREVDLQAEDFVGFIQNAYVDNAAMFTALRSDQVIENILVQLGFSTAQYDLDYGINVINFGQFNQGDRFGDIIGKIVQAENGQFYQDEQGKLKFENRQRWTTYPYFNVQRVITTSQVLDAGVPDTSHLINVVEISASPRVKQPLQQVWKLPSYIEVPANGTYELMVNFSDPMLSVNAPTNYVANTASDGSGTDITSNVSVTYFYAFSKAAKVIFTNSANQSAFLTAAAIYGRPAQVGQQIYYREKDDSSRTAYEEHAYKIDNNEYIQNATWAQSLAKMILADYSDPAKIQKIRIRAVPELQMGDLISWQGRSWRVWGIKTMMDASSGFIQDLQLLQRNVQSYFRIGISTIGGTDQIAP